MAERDGSARRKKKTKRQTIRVPVDEVPRRGGAGPVPLVSEEELVPEDVAAALVPAESDDSPSVPARRAAAKTVVDVELPASLLESLEETTRASDDAPDAGELSVDVDVSDAERISVPPAVSADEASAAMLAAGEEEVDIGDRPTPPPRGAPWPPIPDPGDRPTPPPRPPSAGSLLYPAVPPAVVVMAPIRSIGEAVVEVVPEPVPEPPAERPLLPKMRRPTTQQGVAPAIPPLVDGLDWAAEDSGEVPFEGSLPGEGVAAGDGHAGSDEPGVAPAELEPTVVVTDGADIPPPVEAEHDQVSRLMLPPEPPPVAATPQPVAAPALEPAPAMLPETPPVAALAPAEPAPVALPPPPPPPDLGSPVEVDASVPVVLHDSDPGAVPDERDSDPGTPIDVDAEALHVVPVSTAPEPPPPPVSRIPSAPKIPSAVPPPPPPTPTPAATPTPLPAPPSSVMPAAPMTTPPPSLPGAQAVSPAISPVSVPPPVPGVVVRTEGGERRRKGRKWWEDFFNEEWLRTIPPVPAETTRKECDFIESALGVERMATILDLGCGTGRHAVELAARGYSVVALDLSVTMLDRAQRAADDRDAKVAFQQADMRDLSFDNSFDAVYCIGTTLGLFDEEGNLQVIRNAHRALRENGTFLIEVVNRDFVLQSQPNVVWFEGEGCVCMEETNINYITSRLQVKRTVMPDEGGQTETEYSVRLFSLHELGSLLHRNGFRVIEVSGHWATRGVFFGAHSQRLVVLAEKRVLTEGLPTITQSGVAPLKSGSGS